MFLLTSHKSGGDLWFIIMIFMTHHNHDVMSIQAAVIDHHSIYVVINYIFVMMVVVVVMGIRVTVVVTVIAVPLKWVIQE